MLEVGIRYTICVPLRWMKKHRCQSEQITPQTPPKTMVTFRAMRAIKYVRPPLTREARCTDSHDLTTSDLPVVLDDM